MDKQKQIEEMAKDVTLAGQIAGDWLMEESRKLLKENGRFKSTEHTKTLSDIVAEELTKMGYRKIPENAVVLTEEEYERWQGQTLNIKKVRKETAEKFAEIVSKAFIGLSCIDIDEWNWCQRKIDEICKEITEGKV